jgi:hypothetical protein
MKISARTRLRFTPAKGLKESVLGVTAVAARAKPASARAIDAHAIASDRNSPSNRSFIRTRHLRFAKQLPSLIPIGTVRVAGHGGRQALDVTRIVLSELLNGEPE